MDFSAIVILAIFALNIQNSHANEEINIQNENDSIKDIQLTNGTRRRSRGPEIVMRAENGDEDTGIMGIDKLHVSVLCDSCTEEQMIMKDFMNSVIAAAVSFTDNLSHSKTKPVEIHHRSETSTIYEIRLSKVLQTATNLLSNHVVRKFIDNISRQAGHIFRSLQQ